MKRVTMQSALVIQWEEGAMKLVAQGAEWQVQMLHGSLREARDRESELGARKGAPSILWLRFP